MGRTGGEIRVLYVGDDRTGARVASRIDRADGLDVLTESTPDDALDRIDDADCVVVTHDRSGSDAPSLLERIRDQRPDLPVVLYAPSGDERAASAAITAGVTGYAGAGDAPLDDLPEAVRGAVDVATERRDELERRERQYEALIGDPNRLVGVLDPDGTLRRANERALSLIDADAEAVVGEPFHETPWFDHDPELRERVADLTDRAAAGETVYEESTHPVGDGEIVTAGTIRPVYDDAGDVASLLVETRDVTRERARQAELERYETIVESIGDPVYALDAEDRITLVNDALTTVTGYDRGDLQGAHVSLLMDDDVAARRELVQDLLDRGGGATETLEADLITADGDRIPCETQVGVLTDDGEFAGTTGVIRDISNRNRRERRLRELQRTTRDLIDADTRPEVAEQTAETVVSVLDHPIAGLRLCSDDGERLLPVAMRDAVRTAMGDRPTYAADAAVPAARAFREGETIVVDDFETVDDEPDRGDVRSALYVPVARHGVLCVGDTATDAFGEMERSLAEVLTANAAAMIDRVEQERTSERRLERVEELLSVLSHDLKNLINVAAGRIDLANTGDDNLDAAADALERVDAVIDDAITLVRQGERINEWDHVSLTDTVHDVWRTAGGDAATLSIEGDLGTVACDESGLQQLLENLFRNAVEHGGPAVTVRVGALEEGFYVSDDGPGIPESEREEVFESRYTTAADGTGFGLAIVRSIAEAHGWRIRCTESESGGARFEFHIENEPPSRLDPVQ